MKTRLTLAILATFIFNILYAQLPSTLLWRISGNGLEAPSYLYGTMHLTDSRVFNLSDSLYKAIENSQGFAIEINPDDFTPYIIDEAKKSILRSQRLKDVMSERNYKKYGKALSKKFKMHEDEITTEDVLHEKNKWIEESYRTGKMKTFLDIYLFDIARRQGKWTGGVEDMEDQSGLSDNLVDESDIIEIVNEEEMTLPGGKTGGLNLLIEGYVNEDLNSIEMISSLGDSVRHDRVLIKRNKKMSIRMDSLSRERSMVYAVGAAHLPGKEGLIDLLQKRGFVLTPVFSSKKIKPADYKVKEIPLPWTNVEDESGFYSASMPGKPGNMQLYGVMNMKIYFDVFNSTVYMTTAMNTPYSQHVADSMLSVMSDYYFGVRDYKKGKPITINNIQGREFRSTKKKFSCGYLLYKDGMVYIAIALSMKKDNSASHSFDKFLNSFVIHESTNKPGESSSLNYINEKKAYSLWVPANPVASDDFESSGDTSLERELNIVVDPETGSYFFFGTNEAAKGFIIENDSASLIEIRNTQKDKFASYTLDTLFWKDAHRVLEIGGMMIDAPMMMKAHYETRGNRWYAMVVVYNPEKKNASIEKFFTSFKMLEYPFHQWHQYSPADKSFSTWAPSSITFKDASEPGDSKIVYNYECYDSSRSDTYVFSVEGFSKYYWTKNDSLLMENLVDVSANYNDTILSRKEINNDGIKGIEILKRERGSGNVFRKRFFLNDNKVFSLYTCQQAEEIYNSNTNKFFQDFRITNVKPNSELFTSKADLLIRDINSEDSTTRSDARSSIAIAPFSKEELPLLHQAMLNNYKEEEDEYETTKEKIQRIILNLEDTSSCSFAAANYLTAKEEDKVLLLEIMASYPTIENFNRLTALLLKQPPQKEPGYSFSINFLDSLSLAASVYPDLLPLLNDSIMAPEMIKIAKPLLDSNLIDIKLLKPYQPSIIKLSAKNYARLKGNPDSYSFENWALIGVLGNLDNDVSNSELQNWSSLEGSYMQIWAISKLLKNNQDIDPRVILSIAADMSNRIELFDTLNAYKKSGLFPKKYLTQKYFAESKAYNAAYDDDEPTELNFLTQKTIQYKGLASRFYFYKATYGEDDYISNYLICAGPFDVNTKIVSPNRATGTIYYNEEFDNSRLQEQMDALMKQMEEEQEEKDSE